MRPNKQNIKPQQTHCNINSGDRKKTQRGSQEHGYVYLLQLYIDEGYGIAKIRNTNAPRGKKRNKQTSDANRADRENTIQYTGGYRANIATKPGYEH